MSVKEDLIQFARRYDYHIKDDEDMFRQMELNKEIFGFPVCPCYFIPKDGTIRTSTLIKISCPCAEGIQRLETVGSCMCGLFSEIDSTVELEHKSLIDSVVE